MKKRKKIILLIAFFTLFICLYSMQETYAKYLTTTNGNVKAKIARWNIVVNDTTIKNNEKLANEITPVFVENEHIAQDVIAPTITGYFDLIIDSSNVDVSYTYNIKINESDIISDFVTKSYQIDDNTIIDITDKAAGITDTILYTDTKKVHKIRVFIEWNDDEVTQTMDDTADTAVTFDNEEITLEVAMTFTQLAN